MRPAPGPTAEGVARQPEARCPPPGRAPPDLGPRRSPSRGRVAPNTRRRDHGGCGADHGRTTRPGRPGTARDDPAQARGRRPRLTRDARVRGGALPHVRRPGPADREPVPRRGALAPPARAHLHRLPHVDLRAAPETAPRSPWPGATTRLLRPLPALTAHVRPTERRTRPAARGRPRPDALSRGARSRCRRARRAAPRRRPTPPPPRPPRARPVTARRSARRRR